MADLAPLVYETSTSTGTGNLTLAQVIRRFSDAFGTGSSEDVFHYSIYNEDDPSEWEEGTGHCSDADTLVRDTVLRSSNSNAAVDFSAGTKHIACDSPAHLQQAVPNSFLAEVAANTLKGNNTGSSAKPSDLSVSQVLSLLGAFAGINIQAVTTSGSGTYTPTAGMKGALVFATGAGGGGGGADNDDTSAASAGGSGGGGGTCIKYYTAAEIGASQGYSIGAGGAGGAASGTNGSAGGATTFGTVVDLTANGGNGGEGDAANNDRSASWGGDGGSASGGDINLPGGGGGGAICFFTDSTSFNLRGIGGASFWGSGPAAEADLSPTGAFPGSDGTGPGTGGAGGFCRNNTSGAAGGDGADGMLVVIEFL